jgi:octaprenyl-diphosphate synthase
MKHLADEHARAIASLEALYAPIRAELDQVEQLLQQEFSSQDPFVDRLARHGFRLGGKRMRPALVLLTAQACGAIRHEHVVLGAVMELVHTATLLHDDVLDEATIRRHEATVNARWNNESSILLGDFLLSRAIELVAGLDSPYAFRVIGPAARMVCEGEMRQVHWRGNFDLSEEQYLGVIADKTAALTACCCHLGAHYAGAAPELCERFSRFGRLLGIAFQIADDLLDVLGDEATTGKSMGTDLEKQKPTLPLIRLLGQASQRDRQEILAILTRSDNHRGEALRPWFRDCDAMGYARDQALEFAHRAAQELEPLDHTVAQQMLVALTEFVVSRHT